MYFTSLSRMTRGFKITLKKRKERKKKNDDDGFNIDDDSRAKGKKRVFLILHSFTTFPFSSIYASKTVKDGWCGDANDGKRKEQDKFVNAMFSTQTDSRAIITIIW